MAFPTISAADTKTGTVTSNSTSWTLTYPTNIAAGDLLVACIAIDGSPGVTLPAGWVTHASGPIAVILYVCFKIAVGTETGTFTATLDATEQGAWRIFRIPAASWYGSGVPTGFSYPQNGDGVALSANNFNINNPDPASLDPTNWGVEDTLWFAICAVDTSRTISVYPLADNNTADVSGGAGGATLGVCTTISAVASLDPSTFTISTSDDWGTFTVGVRPAAAAGGATTRGTPFGARGTAFNGGRTFLGIMR